MKLNLKGLNGRIVTVRRSPIYRVLSVLPTPVRPWLIAFEAVTALRLRRAEFGFKRREAVLARELTQAKAAHQAAEIKQLEAAKRGHTHWGLLLVGAGLAYAAARLTAPRTGEALRSEWSDRAQALRAQADDLIAPVRERAPAIVERGRELVETARTQGQTIVSTGVENARRIIDQTRK